MKKRLLSVALALALIVGMAVGGGPLSLTASASDSSYQEHRSAPDISLKPLDWTEISVTCRSGDNLLRGTLMRPKNMPGKVPVAILLHGLCTDKSWCDDLAMALADHGIASVRFDFDGTGESTGAEEDMTVSSEVDDTVAILNYVEGMSFTDQNNIFLVGKSMGGVDAVLASEGRQDEIKAMCLWYPAFGIADAVSHGFLLGQFFDPNNLPETLTAAGYTFGRGFLEETAKLDLTDACKSYGGPVLILHGDQDFIAPIFFSFQMSKVFPDCTVSVIPGGLHGFWGFQEFDAINQMVSFFQEQIPE